MTENQIELRLASTFEEMERGVERLQSFLSQLDKDEEDLSYRIILLASEAITNAMEHGNNWQVEKLATVRLTIGHKLIRLEVADEGGGIRLPGKDEDPLLPENMLNDSGRGVMFMYEYADEVHVNEGDSQLSLVFYR